MSEAILTILIPWIFIGILGMSTIAALLIYNWKDRDGSFALQSRKAKLEADRIEKADRLLEAPKTKENK